MLTRRRFTALSAAAAGAALVAPLNSQAAPTRSGLEFGVQIFMVRDRLKDLDATLALIHQIGYPSIETYPLVYDRPAKELKAQIAAAGLKASSGHFDYPTLEEHVDYAAELGLSYMVCPWIPKPLQDSLEGFHQAAAHFNQAAAKARKAGLTLAFHPHNYEFKKYEGGRGFEILMRELDPAIKIELDIFWAVEAGEDPLALMHTIGERLALIHIKDRKPATGVTFAPDAVAVSHCTEAGAGTLDWKALLGAAHRMGVTQYYVDLDASDIPIDESLRRNWKYLSQLQIG
jgi:sugar phosphate isomerase/epimerase